VYWLIYAIKTTGCDNYDSNCNVYIHTYVHAVLSHIKADLRYRQLVVLSLNVIHYHGTGDTVECFRCHLNK